MAPISQLSKLLCIPVTLVIQYFAYKSSVSNSVKLTLIPITFGVGYATVHDLDISLTGIGAKSAGRCAVVLCLYMCVAWCVRARACV